MRDTIDMAREAGKADNSARNGVYEDIVRFLK